MIPSMKDYPRDYFRVDTEHDARTMISTTLQDKPERFLVYNDKSCRTSRDTFEKIRGLKI